MNDIINLAISDIRSFNRFYTKVLGLINQHILDSPFSLTEVRVLFEIENTNNCTAAVLMESLSIDKGYLSRILKRFEKEGLTYRGKVADDRRISLLSLTQKGKKELSKLIDKSNLQIYELIKTLKETEITQLLCSMKQIEKILTPKKQHFEIREFKKKDIKHIVKRHAYLYSKEFNFDSTFKEYVSSAITTFADNYNPEKENIWIAKYNAEIVGCIGIVMTDSKTAQLRWFLVEPEFRGKGLGKKLMEKAISFCIDKNYKLVFLWTVNMLEPARKLYRQFGFRLTDTHEHNIWGQHLVEERWDLLTSFSRLICHRQKSTLLSPLHLSK